MLSCVHTRKRQVINLRNCCIWWVDLFEKYIYLVTKSVHGLSLECYTRIDILYMYICMFNLV